MNLDLTPEQIQKLKDLKAQFHREQAQIRKKNNDQADGIQDLEP